MDRHERIALVGAVALGVAGVALFVDGLLSGEEGLADQAWFVAFLIAYVVGVRPLVASVRRD